MGGKTSTTTQATTQSIPADVLARYNAVNTRAEQAAAQPFTPYSADPNAFVAPLTPTQQAGVANVNAATGIPGPFFAAATPLAVSGAAPVNPEAITGESVGRYMSPYLGTVLGTTADLLRRQNAQQANELRSGAIRAGAFGGDRAGIAQANLAREQALGAGRTYADILNTGYGQALATAQQQQGVGLGAEQANRAARSAAAQQIAGLGAGAQQAALTGAQAQLGAGTTEQQTQQAGLSALYNQFLQQQGYPFQVAQFLANIALGTGALSGSTTAGTTTQPSSFFSDARMKDNIEPIGKTFDGQDIVKFNYKGSPSKQIGLVAQDVERHHPEAVGVAGGMKTVDYDRATEEAAARGRQSEGGGVVPSRAGEGFADGGATGSKLDMLLRMLTPGRRTDPYGSGGLYGQSTSSEGPYGVYTTRNSTRLAPTEGYRTPQLRPYDYVANPAAGVGQYADGGVVGYADGGMPVDPYSMEAIVARQRAMYPGAGGGVAAGLNIPMQRMDKVQRLDAPRLQAMPPPPKSTLGEITTGMRDVTQTGDSAQKMYNYGKDAYKYLSDLFEAPYQGGAQNVTVGLASGGVAGRHGYATDGGVDDIIDVNDLASEQVNEYNRTRGVDAPTASFQRVHPDTMRERPDIYDSYAYTPTAESPAGVATAAPAAAPAGGGVTSGPLPAIPSGGVAGNTPPSTDQGVIAAAQRAKDDGDNRISQLNVRTKELADRAKNMPTREGPYSQTERWLLPLLSGIGNMASSPSRYFGAALLQGVGAGAGAYGNLQKEQAQIGRELTQADTERLRAETETVNAAANAEKLENERRSQGISALNNFRESVFPFQRGTELMFRTPYGVMTQPQVEQTYRNIARQFGLPDFSALTTGASPSGAPAGAPVFAGATAPAPAPAGAGKPMFAPMTTVKPYPGEEEISDPNMRPSVVENRAVNAYNEKIKLQEGQALTGGTAESSERIRALDEEYKRLMDLSQRIKSGSEPGVLRADGTPFLGFAVPNVTAQADIKNMPAYIASAQEFVNSAPARGMSLDQMQQIYTNLGKSADIQRYKDVLKLATSLPVVGDLIRNNSDLNQKIANAELGDKEAVISAINALSSNPFLQGAPKDSLEKALAQALDPRLEPDARWRRFAELKGTFNYEQAKNQAFLENLKRPVALTPLQFEQQWVANPENNINRFKDDVKKNTPFFKDMTPAGILQAANFKNGVEVLNAYERGMFGPKSKETLDLVEATGKLAEKKKGTP